MWPNIWPLLAGRFQGPLGFLPSFIPRFGGGFFGESIAAEVLPAGMAPYTPIGVTRIRPLIGRAKLLPRSAIEPSRVASPQRSGELMIEHSHKMIISCPGLLDILPYVF